MPQRASKELSGDLLKKLSGKADEEEKPTQGTRFVLREDILVEKERQKEERERRFNNQADVH